MAIWNVVEIHLRRLLHNRVELALTFIVPVVFFSIFALIFGGGIGKSSPRIKAVVVDEAGTSRSARVASLVKADPALRMMRAEDDRRVDREQAAKWLRAGSIAAAAVITDRPIASRDGDQDEEAAETSSLRCDLLSDASDAVAPALVGAIASRAILSTRANRPVGPSPSAAADVSSTDRPPSTGGSLDTAGSPDTDRSPIRVVDVIGDGKSNPVVSMYAAGIAVMFLLFGATGGGGVLLEERENRTLDRLLSTRMTMDQLLIGKWIYISLLGITQVALMFAWAQLVFGVDVIGRLDGLVMMTVVTAGAAAALGLFLATLCRTRGQLNGISVILVLTMSALGGSMVPRYLMSDRLRSVGMWTFNAWALDGYDKIFWRDLPAATLGPQLAMLMVSGLVFLAMARILAIRWERD